MYDRKRYNSKTGRGKIYLAVIVVIILMICYVAVQMVALSVENRIRDIRVTHRDAQEQVEELELTVAELRKGSRIKEIAIGTLGMKMPEGAPERLF